MDDLIAIGEAANILCISPSQIRRIPTDLLPIAQGGGGQHRRYQRQDVLEYLATIRQDHKPRRQLRALLLVTSPTESTRALLQATLYGWAAGQNYEITGMVTSLDEATQHIWSGDTDVIIVDFLATIGTPDAQTMFQSVCTLASVQLLEAHIPLPGVDSQAEALQLTHDMLSAMLAKSLGPSEAGRLADHALTQWREVLSRIKTRDDNGGNGGKGKRPPTPTARFAPGRPGGGG